MIALVVHYEHGSFSTRKLFKVLSCVIYTIIEKYVCIDYFVQKFFLSELKLGLSLETQHEGMDYENLFGIDIPDIFMNMLLCQGFINNNNSIVILKCPNIMSQYYFNKGLTQLKCDEDHLKKIPKNIKERVGAELKVNTDLVMLCHTTITSTSSTLKNLYIGKHYHSLYSNEN